MVTWLRHVLQLLYPLKLIISRLPSLLAGGAMVMPPGGFPFLGSLRGKPRRGMLRRAVFSDFQRKGLEKMFQSQKYISKPDRKKLADKLMLKDSQVCIYIND